MKQLFDYTPMIAHFTFSAQPRAVMDETYPVAYRKNTVELSFSAQPRAVMDETGKPGHTHSRSQALSVLNPEP